ncbi:hypothetical protein GCM10027614_33180 [Micromonospora vulcania]
MSNRPLAAAGRLVPLLRAGLIAGIVVAAAAYPLVALTGLGAKATAHAVEHKTKLLTTALPAETSYVYAPDGKTVLTMFYEEYRQYTKLSDMSPNIQQAIVAAEDSRFYQHHGVDPKGVARAFVANANSSGVSQGASTLTMQYVRMALRDSATTPKEVQEATQQTSLRKVKEMRMALDLEKELSKEQILERYLNSAYFGHRAYGIYAASEIFFSKTPKDLTPVEAATLAGLVKSPSEYDPADSDQKEATGRRNYVLDRMSQLGYLSRLGHRREERTDPAEADRPAERLRLGAGEVQQLGLRLRLPEELVEHAARVRGEPAGTDGQAAPGRLPDRAQHRSEGPGRAEKNVGSKENTGSPFANGIVVSEPGTGRVKAMAVNRTYSLDLAENPQSSNPEAGPKVKANYPNTVAPLLGGGDLPGYQAGSTFKMFPMLAALDSGMTLSTSFNAPYRYKSSVYDGWAPSNASGAMTGQQTMWSGFGKSVNTYFVWLEERVGADRAVRLAEQLGLRWRTDVDREQASPTNAKKWGRSPWASPTPPRWRWRTRTPPSRPTAATARRSRFRRS